MSIEHQIAQWIDELLTCYPFWGLAFFFAVAFGESLVIVGLFLPSAAFMALAGFLAAQGYFNVLLVDALVIVGSYLGDVVSYEIGRHADRWVIEKGSRFLKQSHLDMARRFFDRHGGKSLILGRFVHLLRWVIAFSAGMSRMPLRIFLFYDAIGAILWCSGMVGAGYMLRENWRLVNRWLTDLGGGIFVILALGVLLYYLWRRRHPPAVIEESRPLDQDEVKP